MKKIIIVDRDGVINEDSTGYIKHPDEWEPIPGSLRAIAQLYQAGFIVVVITNQSGIGRGLYTESDLTRIHEKMISAIEASGGKIEKIYYCAHAPEENCACRKPAPGMFHQLEKDFHITLNEAEHLYIGDKMTDVMVARNAHCRPILVRTGYGTKTLEKHPELKNDIDVYDDLEETVSRLLSGRLHNV